MATLTLAALAIAAVLPSFADAQSQSLSGDTFLKQQRQMEENIRLELDKSLPDTRKIDFDYGGWLSEYLYQFDDGKNSSRTLRQTDLRLWSSFNLDQGIHSGYVRMKATYDDWNAGDLDGDEDDMAGPNLERGWYELNLTKLLATHGDLSLPFDFSTRVGRDYILWGTGYALSLPMDAVQFEGNIGKLSIDGLLGRTIHSWDNLDQSRPNADQSWRYFYGVQTRYTGFQKHHPFLYYVWQNDNQDDGPPWFYHQQWRYDSRYLSLGSSGEFATNWRYSTEWVLENGKSYPNGSARHRSQIDAWAYDALLEYLMPVAMKPRFALEYMFASGDSDRLGSPTDAVGGNRAGTKDLGFNGFGYRDTGLALAPDLSNIHITRAGYSMFPFERQTAEWLQKIEMGTDWFLYIKHHSAGAISDSLATNQSGYVGWEMDYYMNWRITSDLAWTVRYGLFFPGDAFDDKNCRPFAMTGLTWSF